MKLGLECIAYKEERFIKPFIEHWQPRVDEILVLNTAKPWYGEDEGSDNTADIARSMGASVITYNWTNEEEQRNAGLEYFSDCDYVLIIDPDEFMSDEDFATLLTYLEYNVPALIVDGQFTYWKDGYVAYPFKDYKQLIAVKPNLRFIDKRVINSPYAVAPVWLHHFSWARTNEEVWRKISHYAHAKDFDIEDWYNNVWLKWQPGDKDAHPTSPDTLHEFIKAQLPEELEKLNLWP